MAKRTRLKPMKSSNVNIRISDDLKEKVDYLKLLPGGITRFVEEAIRGVTIDRTLLAKLKQYK